MNDKQMQLIQAGIKLFANKGYYHTSIQEIANEAGVSKGSFYIYFQSKEEFIATAYRHFYNQLTEKLDKVKTENLPPREILAKQITVLMGFADNFKDFFGMYGREDISIGEDIDSFIQEVKEYNYNWMKEMILSIYGPKQKSLLLDTMVQFDGLLNGYLKWVVVNDMKIDKARAGEFIVSRLDDVVHGMKVKEEKPLIYECDQNGEEPLTVLRRKLEQLNIDEEHRKQLREVVDTLEAESKKQVQNPVIVQGLLAHFSPIKELEDECRQLADAWEIELLPL